MIKIVAIAVVGMLVCASICSAEEPISITCSKLPAKYNGNNAVNITQALSEYVLSQTKSQYETTQQFSARISNTANAKITENLNLDSVLSFSIDINSFKSPMQSYDADSSTVSVKLHTLPVYDNEAKPYSDTIVPVYMAEKITGNYVGSNLYGAKANIDVKEHHSIMIAVYNNPKSPIYNLPTIALDSKYPSIKNPTITLPNVQPDTARHLYDKLRLLYLIKLRTPYLVEKVLKTEASMKYKSEDTWVNQWLISDVLDIWLYNYETGEILLKLNGQL